MMMVRYKLGEIRARIGHNYPVKCILNLPGRKRCNPLTSFAVKSLGLTRFEGQSRAEIGAAWAGKELSQGTDR